MLSVTYHLKFLLSMPSSNDWPTFLELSDLNAITLIAVLRKQIHIFKRILRNVVVFIKGCPGNNFVVISGTIRRRYQKLKREKKPKHVTSYNM